MRVLVMIYDKVIPVRSEMCSVKAVDDTRPNSASMKIVKLLWRTPATGDPIAALQ